MTTMLQLNSPLSVATPLGWGIAYFIIDYGIDWNTVWVVALHDNNKIKHFDSNDIRIAENPTYGREVPDLPTPESF